MYQWRREIKIYKYQELRLHNTILTWNKDTKLNRIFWGSNITKNTNIRIYTTSESLIESVAICGSELWVVNKRDTLMIRGMEMNYWHRCCPLLEWIVRNAQIQAKMESSTTFQAGMITSIYYVLYSLRSSQTCKSIIRSLTDVIQPVDIW